MDIYLRIGALMEKHNMTNQSMADKTGIPIGTISGIRSGKIQNPGFENVCALLSAMDESIDVFYGLPSQSSQFSCASPPDHQLHTAPNIVITDARRIAQDAVQGVYESAAIVSLSNSLMWWRFLAIALLAFILFFLIYDITHPTMGYIQYSAAFLPSAHQIFDDLRSII